MKNSRKFLTKSRVTSLLTAVIFMLCNALIPTFAAGEVLTQKNGGTLVTYPVQSCYQESGVASMTVNGEKVPVIKFLNNYDHAQFSFSFPDTAIISITVNEDIEKFSVSPLAKNIEATANGRTLTFSISESTYMIVKINGIKEIVVIADDIESDVPAAAGAGIYNIAADYQADPTGTESVTAKLQQAIDDAAANGGIAYVPAGLYKLDGNIELPSNSKLYLEGGAVIRCTPQPENFESYATKNIIYMASFTSIKRYTTWVFRTALGADNIKVYGRGTVDGNGSALYTGTISNGEGWCNTLFYIRQCTNFTMDGVTVKDCSYWTIETKLCKNLTFTNIKVLNDFDNMTENDAIDICESRHALVRHMFAISEDDTYSTKTYTASGKISDKGEVDVYSDYTLDDVTFDDCFGWTHCGTFKVGDGSNFSQSNVTFKNSYSYKCMQALKINHAYGGADYTNILYDNIDIETYGGRSATDRRWLIIDTFSGTQDDPGNIVGLTIRNINIRELGSTKSTMKGRDGDNNVYAYVHDVTFENIRVPGQAEYASSLREMNILDTNAAGTSDYRILPVDNDHVGTVDYSDSLTLLPGAGAVSSSDESDQYTAPKAIDGNESTRWAAGSTNGGENIVIDFGAQKEFNHVRLIWSEDAYASEYKIQYSSDNSSWTDIVTETAGAVGEFNYDFDRVTGRYLRVYVNTAGTKNNPSLKEVQAFNRDFYDFSTNELGPLIVETRIAKRDYTESVLRKYTDESVQAYRDALAAAEAVIANEDRENAAAALTALTDAISGLTTRAKPSSALNLALNRPVTASGEQNNTSQAYKAVDGSTSSAWRSQTSGAPYWIYVDLGEKKGFDYICINWEDTFATSYKLQVSDDAVTWTDVSVNGEIFLIGTKKETKDLYLDETQNARYVRVYCIEKSTTWGVGIFEFEVYDLSAAETVEEEKEPIYLPNVNLALNKSVTATSSDSSLPASNAVDGNSSTRWGRNPSNKDDPHDFTVDLGDVYWVDTVSVTWSGANNTPGEYSISVSEDGSKWTTVTATKTPAVNVSQTDDTFDIIPARYVRLHMTTNASTKYLSIHELEIYGNAVPPTRIISHAVAQRSSQADANGNYEIRFIAAVDGLDHDLIGFRVSASDAVWGDSFVREFTDKHVYTSIGGAGSDTLGIENGYVFALVVEDVPANCEITVTPLVYDGQTAASGKTKAFTLVNGAIG